MTCTLEITLQAARSAEECTIGNGPHLYQKGTSAEALPDQIGNIGLALDVMANWIAEKGGSLGAPVFNIAVPVGFHTYPFY